jgi:predicted amidophosphoribosyltransferase
MNNTCQGCGAQATLCETLCASCLEHIARITAERFNRMLAETSNPKPATSPEGANQEHTGAKK